MYYIYLEKNRVVWFKNSLRVLKEEKVNLAIIYMVWTNVALGIIIRAVFAIP